MKEIIQSLFVNFQLQFGDVVLLSLFVAVVIFFAVTGLCSLLDLIHHFSGWPIAVILVVGVTSMFAFKMFGIKAAVVTDADVVKYQRDWSVDEYAETGVSNDHLIDDNTVQSLDTEIPDDVMGNVDGMAVPQNNTDGEAVHIVGVPDVFYVTEETPSLNLKNESGTDAVFSIVDDTGEVIIPESDKIPAGESYEIDLLNNLSAGTYEFWLHVTYPGEDGSDVMTADDFGIEVFYEVRG